MRVQSTLLAVLSVLMALAGACSTAPVAPAKPTPTGARSAAVGAPSGGEVVRLTAWTIGPDAPSFYRRDNLVAAAETLNLELEKEGARQRVQVEASFESGGQWGDFKQKFTLAAEAGRAPDIILAGHEDLAPWSSAGYVIELDGLLRTYEARFAEVYPSLWPAMRFRGKTYAIPQDTEARPMFFRKDLLAKLGWPRERIDGLPEAVRRGDWTMVDLLATAREAVDKGVVAPGYGWFHRPTRGHDHYLYYYQQGGQMQDEASGKLVIVRDALERHFQLHHDAVRVQRITPDTLLGMDFRQWHETVSSGKVLFANGGTWFWKEWQQVYRVPEQSLWDNVGFTLIPAAQRGGRPTTLSHPLVYMVTSSSKAPELAFRLLAHATTPELNSRHALESAHLGILRSQERNPTYQRDRFLVAAGYLTEYATFIPNHPKYGIYDEVIFRLLSAVEAGQLTPNLAADSRRKMTSS